jgi:hypothetical protein
MSHVMRLKKTCSCANFGECGGDDKKMSMQKLKPRSLLKMASCEASRVEAYPAASLIGVGFEGFCLGLRLVIGFVER